MNRTRILLRGALPVILWTWAFSLSLPKHIQACTLSQFLSFAQDHLNAPGDLSICRHRSPPARSSGITVSAIVFLLQRGKPPQIWYRLGQPCEGPFKKAFF